MKRKDNEDQPLARANRNRRPPERYGNRYTFNTTQQKETAVEPKTYDEAVKRRNTGSKQCKQKLNH